MDRQIVRDEMEQAQQAFHRLLDSATVAGLSRPSNGTKWTNGQLLFHMLFGYLIVVRLLVLDRVIDTLTRHLDRESDSELSRGMHYPTSWGPYFQAYMTLADVYRSPTQHFEHHRRQLTLDAPV